LSCSIESTGGGTSQVARFPKKLRVTDLPREISRPRGCLERFRVLTLLLVYIADAVERVGDSAPVSDLLPEREALLQVNKRLRVSWQADIPPKGGTTCLALICQRLLSTLSVGIDRVTPSKKVGLAVIRRRDQFRFECSGDHRRFAGRVR
jgi:hypothetical protein